MRRRKRPTIDVYINAILDRDEGIPYSHVLDTYNITPNQFFYAATTIHSLAQSTEGNTRKTLEEIAKNAARGRELLNMGKQIIMEQYNLVLAGAQAKMPRGTLRHPENIKTLVHYALICDNMQLASRNRQVVIEEIKKLPSNLAEHLSNLKLLGVMTKVFEGSPLEALKVFDAVYQEKTKDSSLFDLTQKEHLHEWEVAGHAPNVHWRYPKNVEKAVYHILTEEHPELASNVRKEVIKGIENMPIRLQSYIYSLGLGGLISKGFENEKSKSPLAVLETFDAVYQKKTGDASLFDLTQEDHLHEWGTTRVAPQSYWKNPENVKKAAYHILTEEHPELGSHDRKIVIKGIMNLPSALQGYFGRLGLAAINIRLGKEKKSSPLETIKMFDAAYQEKTGDASLFDLAQENHLHEWEVAGHVSNVYWKNPANVKKVIYHVLTEEHPKLASSDRNEVIQRIKKLPSQLSAYFFDIGFAALMYSSFKKISSPRDVLKTFDKAYQEKTGDYSLFDVAQDDYLKFSGKNELIRK